MEELRLKCEERDNKDLSDTRAIYDAVWHQIRVLAKSDLNIGRILIVDQYGRLKVNEKTRLLTEEEKRYLARLLDNERDGIYRDNQFKDLDKRTGTKKRYNTWFDEKATDSFMLTVPTRKVLCTHPARLYYKLRRLHSSDELNKENFSGYSIWQTLYALDLINPFLIGLILGGDIKVVEIGFTTYIRFKYNGEYYYALKDGVELYKKDENDKLVKLNDTIHTLLFKHYREPIFTALNSMMLPIGGNRVMPFDGEVEVELNPDLYNATRDVLASETYQKMKENYYDVGRSRILNR